MSVPNGSWFTTLRQRLPAAIGELPLLTAAEQTKLSWARRIAERAETPPYFLKTVDALLAETGSLPYLVLTPSYASFLVPTTEKLVCLLEQEIRIYERVGDEPRLTACCYSDVCAIEHGSVLLKSWIRIMGATARTAIKFNTVTDYLFLPVIERLRGGERESTALLHACEQAKFDYLAPDFYKFMNIGRKSILPGERVAGSVMQGELRTPFVTLLGHTFTRLRAPAHLVVCTDRELILAVEESQDAWGSSHRYGSVRTYIPLAQIASAELRGDDADDGCVRLAIQLRNGDRIDQEFMAAQEPALRRLLEAMGSPAFA